MKTQNIFLNLFFVLLHTYILDDSIKSPNLILTADHSTLLFLPSLFYQIKNFSFLLWVNLYMITGIHLHDPPPFNEPSLFWVSKSCDPPAVSNQDSPPPPPLLLISDTSLRKESNSYRNCFKHQYARRFIVLEHRYGRRDVMWIRSWNSDLMKMRQASVLAYLVRTALVSTVNREFTLPQRRQR